MTTTRHTIAKNRVWFIIVAIPRDSNIEGEELEKIAKYYDFQVEIAKTWKKSKGTNHSFEP